MSSSCAGVQAGSTDRLVNLVPDLVDKVTGLFKKDKDKEKTEGEETDVQPEVDPFRCMYRHLPA